MRETKASQNAGELIASVLAGAWRSVPPPLELTAEQLSTICSLLLGSRAGALAWWKAQQSTLSAQADVEKLRGAYHVYSVEHTVHQQTLRKIFELLNAENIRPILYKGWAVAQYYPQPALRPYLDFDLIVPPQQEKQVTDILKRAGIRNFDLEHYELNRFDSRTYDELLERSRIIKFDETDIRVPGTEDHLRLLCIHLLKHGGSGPLWLCDVGAVIEKRPADFDWDRFLGKNRRQADWVAYTLGMANRILGAKIDDTPVYSIAQKLPGWMERSVISDWSTPRRILHIHDRLMAESMGKASEFISALRSRWPNPIEATVIYNGSFNRASTFGCQFRFYARQAVKFASKGYNPASE